MKWEHYIIKLLIIEYAGIYLCAAMSSKPDTRFRVHNIDVEDNTTDANS
jgi:hypothetical protein